MLLKCRTESGELLVMRSLSLRMDLNEKERFNHFALEKGYEGEVTFDQLTENLHEERYIINDLLLEVNNSYLQIDSLIISQGVIHLLEIKNYQGDYCFDADKLYSLTTSRENKNPLVQLKRSAGLLRQLIQNLKLNYLVEPYVIFINPEFTLYQAPTEEPFILPTQLNRFLNNLNKTPSKLTNGHRQLAQKLISLHHHKNPFTVLPKYNYDQLRKGMYCNKCKSFEVYKERKHIVCNKCGEREVIEQAILRNVKEFRLLFPERRITTKNIYDWCQVDLNRRTICRVLKKNFTVSGKTSDTCYI